MSLLGNQSNGKIVVISAPAGTGKTTLAHMLLKEFSNHVMQSITCTTRPPRRGEKDQKDYYFLTEEQFNSYEQKGDFLETATVFSHRYGTLKRDIFSLQSKGKYVLLVIDTQGAMSVKTQIEDALYLFISPPSIEVLRKRLEKRATDCPATISERLSFAKQEMDMAKHYDYVIINDDLKEAYEVLRSVIIAEDHKQNKEVL